MSWLKRLPEAPMVSILLGINLAVFVAMAIGGHQMFAFDMKTLVRAGANVVLAPGTDVEISRWRWLTAAFIHVNLVHLLMNMTFLVQLGVLSERFAGGGLLAAAYVVTGVAGNMLSAAWAIHRGTELRSAGASGALMGILGMVAVLAWRADLKPLAKALLKNAAFIVVLGLGLSVSGHGVIDNGAHLGGLITGALIGWGRSRIRRPLSRGLNRTLAAGAFAVTAVAFAAILAAHGTH
jgi:rhomboid protease GluP